VIPLDPEVDEHFAWPVGADVDADCDPLESQQLELAIGAPL
jgi:hypothetical protein